MQPVLCRGAVKGAVNKQHLGLGLTVKGAEHPRSKKQKLKQTYVLAILEHVLFSSVPKALLKQILKYFFSGW